MASTGRNDPCSCGSGRKFKQCCLRQRDAEDAARIRLRTAEGLLTAALFAYAADEFGPAFLQEAWEEFFLWEDVPGGDRIVARVRHDVRPVLRVLVRP